MARLLVSFNGINAVGNVSVSGLKAGDRVLNIVSDSFATFNIITFFSSLVKTDDELRQIVGSDLTSNTFYVLLERELLI